jgi:hypothetical protein
MHDFPVETNPEKVCLFYIITEDPTSFKVNKRRPIDVENA